MKMFVSVFLAILAAAAVIYAFLNRKNELEQWEKTKQACIVRLELSKREKHEITHSRTESRTAFILQMKRRHALDEDAEHVTAKLISLLEHKPRFFGFSPAQLTQEESAQLKDQKWIRDEIQKMTAELRVAEKAWAEAEAEASMDEAKLRAFKEELNKFGK